MRYKRFEDLPVWNTAIELAIGVYQLTSSNAFTSQYSLKDQLERAAVSVSNNIAEGFERGTNNELIHFLYIARGSSGEARSLLSLLQRLPSFATLHREILTLQEKAESCSKQIKGWTEALQNSDWRGERHVNYKLRLQEESARERDEFLKELEEIKHRKRPAS